jgi:hypothetical protein
MFPTTRHRSQAPPLNSLSYPRPDALDRARRLLLSPQTTLSPIESAKMRRGRNDEMNAGKHRNRMPVTRRVRSLQQADSFDFVLSANHRTRTCNKHEEETRKKRREQCNSIGWKRCACRDSQTGGQIREVNRILERRGMGGSSCQWGALMGNILAGTLRRSNWLDVVTRWEVRMGLSLGSGQGRWHDTVLL